MKKSIQEKLKELKNVLIQRLFKTMCVFWCTHDFNKSIYIPSLYFQEKYDVYGCFVVQMCSYLFQQNIDNTTKYERYQLLNYYMEDYNYKKK